MNALEQAKQIVNGARQQDYGHPYDDFSRTAKIWEALLGIPVTPNQVALCMIGVKLSRETHKHKDDNLVDSHGYLNCLEMVIQKQNETKRRPG